MSLVALKKLHADSRNANDCPEDVLSKIKRHIEKTGFCPSLIVRPHPNKKGHFIIVDGHHRMRVIQELGWTEVECQIKAMSDQEASVYLLTLNRLRGTDIPRKRAELIQGLLPHFSLNDLSALLPESEKELEGLLALLELEEEALNSVLQKMMEDEAKTLPVPFGFMVSAQEAEIVRETLLYFQSEQQKGPDLALVAMCQDVLSQRGKGNAKKSD